MDQAIGGYPVKREVQDKRLSLRNKSGNLLDIHRVGQREYGTIEQKPINTIHAIDKYFRGESGPLRCGRCWRLLPRW